MWTMTATEASRGFSDLLDRVERGETVLVTRGGRVVAEIRPPMLKTGRDLDAALGESRLTDDDAEEMLRIIAETHALLLPYDGDPWADD
jgi:antitoxin (DNA-binding transcriptional repressor) of toxin-antitoxin stability system